MSAKSKVIQLIETVSVWKDWEWVYQLFNHQWELVFDSNWTIIVGETLAVRISKLSQKFIKSEQIEVPKWVEDYVKDFCLWIDNQWQEEKPKSKLKPTKNLQKNL